MNYVSYINQELKSFLDGKKDTVLLGQNIGTGSCLSGLTRGLNPDKNSVLLNTPNCENTLVGVGMGLTLAQVDCTYFVKQLDFTILGLDQMLNTYNIIRTRQPQAAFNIFAIVVDSGYEGGQASFNNMQAMSALCDIPCFGIQSKGDADYLIQDVMRAPGFRIICVSQRMFRDEVILKASPVAETNREINKYSYGSDLAIVCFNFSLPHGLDVEKHIDSKGFHSSVFTVSATKIKDWSVLTNELQKFDRVLLIDDSKSPSLLINELKANLPQERFKALSVISRQNLKDAWYRPDSEKLEYNMDKIYQELFVSSN